MPKHILLVHVPVIHEGFIRLFHEAAPCVSEVCIFGKSIVGQFPLLGKRIEMLDPELAATLVRAMGIFTQVSVVEEGDLPTLADDIILMADDHASRVIHERHFPETDVSHLRVFLSWEPDNVQTLSAADYDCEVSEDPRDKEIMGAVETEARKSPDPWRKVAAALTRDKTILRIDHNKPLTSDHTQHAFGDVRCFLPAGKMSHLGIPDHAEPIVIGAAAREGEPTKGCAIYTKYFPCPPCGRLIIGSGIAELYFRYGWANLDSLELLQMYGIRIIKVP